jgi:hypothetical protein
MVGSALAADLALRYSQVEVDHSRVRDHLCRAVEHDAHDKQSTHQFPRMDVSDGCLPSFPARQVEPDKPLSGMSPRSRSPG